MYVDDTDAAAFAMFLPNRSGPATVCAWVGGKCGK